MNAIQSLFVAGASALLLCSCNPAPTVSTEGGSVQAGPDKITLRADGLPNAHIDAAGNLLIDGKKVAVTASQQDLLKVYQREFNGMTQDGIAMGKQGAAMAGKAVTAAIKGAIGGDGENIEKKMEAEARLMEKEALKLCRRLIVIREVQDQLATELPAFKPYAGIKAGDVDDCHASGSDAVEPTAPAVPVIEPDSAKDATAAAG